MITIHRLKTETGKSEPIQVDGGFVIGKDCTGRTCRVASLGFNVGMLIENYVLHTSGARFCSKPFERLEDGRIRLVKK